jgi:hypothetical protein
MRKLSFAVISGLAVVVLSAHAADFCFVFHGRAHYYSGDANLRIWRIGTHHEYEPDRSSLVRVENWIETGVLKANDTRYGSSLSNVDLYGNFLACPTEPFKLGSVQHAIFIRVLHRRYVRAE